MIVSWKRSMRRGACLVALLVLSGCSAQFHETLGGSNGEQSPNVTWWPKPVHGMYLCLSTPPGMPVYDHCDSNFVIGYTRNVVAFYGEQVGNSIRIIYYNGAMGWIDGRRISPYHGPTPDSVCIVPGVDLYQRPVFEMF